MSYEIDWWVAQMPIRTELEHMLVGICRDAGLPLDAFSLEWNTEIQAYDIVFRISSRDAPSVQAAFGAERGWAYEDFIRHMNLPERRHLKPEDGVYEVDCSLVGEQLDEDPPTPPLVLAGEGTSDNNVAWPLIELLAGVLAERIGIHPEDDDRGNAASFWIPPPKIV